MATATSAVDGPPSVPLPRALQSLRFVVRPVSFVEHWRRELGETFHASIIGPGEVVFISDPGSIATLFKADRANTIAPGRNIVLRPLLGPGSLLLQEGEEHLRRRKLMLPPFHGERMRAYEDEIRDATLREVATWPIGEPFPLHPSMQAITLDVILRAVFGVTDAERRDPLAAGLVEVLAMTASARAVGVISPVLRRVPPWRRLGSISARIDELLNAEIAERRTDPAIGERDDILSMLVRARFEDGEPMKDSELRDQLMTLLLAGHETTATALAWAFDLLLHHPEPLARLREELAGSGGGDYLDAVCREALRIRPVVPFTGRELMAPMSLGGFELASGTVVLVSIYLAHMRVETWGDPYSFRPERFVDDGPETYSWVPFGGGTRRCIGASFAEMEMRVALRTILESVELKAVRPPERPMRRNVTMSPAGGTVVVAN